MTHRNTIAVMQDKFRQIQEHAVKADPHDNPNRATNALAQIEALARQGCRMTSESE